MTIKVVKFKSKYKLFKTEKKLKTIDNLLKHF